MKQARSTGHIWQMAWVVALSIVIPLSLGIWLDRRFGMASFFILLGALAGILAGTVGVVRIATRAMEALSGGSDAKGSAEEEEIGKED